LSIFHCNIRSLRNKLNYIYMFMTF
jgi:hypothetical protein